MSAGQLACMLQDINMSYVSTRQSSASERIIITHHSLFNVLSCLHEKPRNARLDAGEQHFTQ
jgi:hypothetical protein